MMLSSAGHSHRLRRTVRGFITRDDIACRWTRAATNRLWLHRPKSEEAERESCQRFRRDEARFFLTAALFAAGFFFAALVFRFGAARFFFTGFAFGAADVACPTAAAPLSSTLAKLLKTEPVAEMAAEPNVFAPSPASRIPLFFAMHVPCRSGRLHL
jgi:hypothetical protein